MGFWFGRKNAPETRPNVPAWLRGGGEHGGLVRGYEAQLNEVFHRNPIGLRSVRLVAGLVGLLPLFAEEGDARAVDLIRVAGLLERTTADLLLHGNAYVRLAVDGHDRPAELHGIRPERVSVVCGADGWPSAYLYRAGAQVTRITKTDALGRRQVAHLKTLNPIDDHFARSLKDRQPLLLPQALLLGPATWSRRVRAAVGRATIMPWPVSLLEAGAS